MRTKRYKLLIFLLLLVSLTACGKPAREENQTLLEKATIRDPEAAEASIMSEDESAPEKNGIAFSEDPASMERAAQSVVKLEVYDEQNKRIGTGTGFCCFDPSLLVTAAHVIVNMDHMIATCDNGDLIRIDRCIGGNENSDIALCALPDGVRLTPLSVSDAEPLRGEKTVAIGSQFGVANLITLGNICGRWEAGGVRWLLFTAPVSGGCSGGPLLNNDGFVIGMITATYDDGQNLNVATPISEAESIQ